MLFCHTFFHFGKLRKPPGLLFLAFQYPGTNWFPKISANDHAFQYFGTKLHPGQKLTHPTGPVSATWTPVSTVLYTVLYQGSRCRGSRCPTLFPKLDIWTPVSTVLYTVIPGVQMSGVQVQCRGSRCRGSRCRGSRCRGSRCRGSRCRGSRCPIPPIGHCCNTTERNKLVAL